MTRTKAITVFWSLFAKRADALARIRSADEPVYDELLDQIQTIDPGLFVEFSAQPGSCELIITAEGDSSLFPLVDAVVSAAPQLDGWQFFALKPKLGFPKSVVWEGYEVSIADVVFEPLSASGSDDLGLRLLVPGLDEGDRDRAHNGLLRALDHGLGERAFAQAVQHTEVATLEGPADEHIPLEDLERFIEWRRKRREPR
jgi:hypothetical protein